MLPLNPILPQHGTANNIIQEVHSIPSHVTCKTVVESLTGVEYARLSKKSSESNGNQSLYLYAPGSVNTLHQVNMLHTLRITLKTSIPITAGKAQEAKEPEDDQ